MIPFTAKIEMRGRPIGYMIIIGLFILAFAALISALVWYDELPDWVGWITIIPMVIVSSWLFIWSAICRARHVYWSFEANEQKMHWFRSDRYGAICEEKEVDARDIVEVWKSRGGDTDGLYLKLRSGDTIEIGSVAQPEDQFLDWIEINHPNINLNIE